MTAKGLEWVKRNAKYDVLLVLSPIMSLILWEILVRVGLMDHRFFPAPTTVIGTLFRIIVNGQLLDHVSISLYRMAIGFLLGSFAGIVLGLLMGWLKIFYAIFDPLISAVYPIPKTALLPVIFLIFGIGELSKIVIVAIAAFFMAVINTTAGVLSIDPVIIDAARNFGARRGKLFRHVLMPGALPSIFTGLRLALGASLLVIVAAEFVASNEGIGYLIWISWQTLATEKMYAGLIVIAILGILSSYGLKKLGNYLMPWSVDVGEKM